MDLGLKGKTAVISGGSKGIGAGIAEVLAEEGVNLVLVYRSDKEGSDAFAAQLSEKYGVDAMAYMADVTDPSLIDGIYDAANERFGKVDILINNAASGYEPKGQYGGGQSKEFEELTWEDWNRCMDGCLNHVFSMTRRFVADCKKEKRGGHIVNVLAKAAITSNSIHLNIPYITSKGGETLMTRGLANALINDGIYVNGIIPGYVISKSNYQPGSPAYKEKEKFLRVGWATPKEMGNIAAFLCSEKAKQIVGALVDCSGGTML